jgi:hypothetical protein
MEDCPTHKSNEEQLRRTRSGVAVGGVPGPSDSAVLEIQSDEVAVVRKFLAIDDLPADRVFIFQRSDPDDFASLPRTVGDDPGTMSADVICVRYFFSVDGVILRGR